MLKQISSKMSFGLLVFGVMTASAASYRVSIHQDANVDGKQIKAGDYKVDVKDNTAVLKHGKEVIEVPVKTETAASKFNSTQIQYGESNSMKEIRIGGTNTKLVFGSADSTRSGM